MVGVVGVSDGTERLVAEIPVELKRHVDADRRTNKEVVIAALTTEYGGKRDGAIERQISENQDRALQAASEIEDRIDEIHGYARENHKLRSVEGDKKEQQRKYAKKLLDNYGGVPAPENPAAENYAQKAGMNVWDFVELMKEVQNDA